MFIVSLAAGLHSPVLRWALLVAIRRLLTGQIYTHPWHRAALVDIVQHGVHRTKHGGPASVWLGWLKRDYGVERTNTGV